jgi:serine/threonine protein kinase
MECSVNDMIKNKEKLNYEEIILFEIQVILSIWRMKYIYKIQHRDIKPDNILRYSKNWYAISDFGTCKFKFDSVHTLRACTVPNFKRGIEDSNIGNFFFFFLILFFLLKKKKKNYFKQKKFTKQINK